MNSAAAQKTGTEPGCDCQVGYTCPAHAEQVPITVNVPAAVEAAYSRMTPYYRRRAMRIGAAGMVADDVMAIDYFRVEDAIDAMALAMTEAVRMTPAANRN